MRIWEKMLWKKRMAALLATGMLAGMPGVPMPTAQAQGAVAQSSGITWTVDGDTVTFSGESSRTELRNDSQFQDVLNSAKHIKFQRCKITGDMSYFFSGLDIESIDLSGLDTSSVTDMSDMFDGCSGLKVLDLSSLNTSGVTDMSNMFDDCSGLKVLDLSSLNTSGVTNMSSMFNGCSGLTALNLSNLDTSSVTRMVGMFYDCRGLTALDVSGFDTGRVTDMGNMFSGCSGLTALDLSNLNTSNVTNMAGMFGRCSGLTALDVSNFDTGSVTNMAGMFGGCSSLTALGVSNFDTGSVTSMLGMFHDCSGLTALDVSGFDTGSVTDMAVMFGGCSGLTALDVSGFVTGSVTDMTNMFGGCSGLTALNLSGLNTSSVTNMLGMFSDCRSLTELDLSGFNTGSVTVMSGMFADCSSLTALNLSNWDTSSVTNMRGMFIRCRSLTTLDVSSLDTSSVTEMISMFEQCNSLTRLNVSNFNTGNVTDMESMFYNCGGLTELDLSGFDTSKAATSYMLSSCAKLTTLKTPSVMGNTAIGLPAAFVDPNGRETNRVMADFCNTTLIRKGTSPEPDPGPVPGPDPAPGPDPGPTPEPAEPDTDCELTGTIVGHNGVAYSGISAKLMGLDGTVYTARIDGGNSMDGAGAQERAYSITAPAGRYSLVVAATVQGNMVSRTFDVVLKNNNDVGRLYLPDGQAQSRVVVNKSGTKALVGGLDSLVMKEDGTMKESGVSNVEVTFTIDRVMDESGSAHEGTTQIMISASGKMLEFYDFSLWKTVKKVGEQGSRGSQITDTGDVLVTIVLPFDRAGKEDIKVYRFHGGSVDVLTEQEAGGEKIVFENGSLIIHAKKFSVYAIGYSAAGSAGGSGSSDSSNDSRRDVVEDQIRTAAKGAVVRLKGVTMLSNGAMKTLLARKDVTLIMEYAYNGKNYLITIPAGAAVNNAIPWYGPLYLASIYGNGAAGGIAAFGSAVDGSAYIVKQGDTMSGIARSKGMSLAQLVAGNPQIRNIDLILVGQTINLR